MGIASCRRNEGCCFHAFTLRASLLFGAILTAEFVQATRVTYIAMVNIYSMRDVRLGAVYVWHVSSASSQRKSQCECECECECAMHISLELPGLAPAIVMASQERLKLGSGVGWCEPERSIPRTRW